MDSLQPSFRAAVLQMAGWQRVSEQGRGDETPSRSPDETRPFSPNKAGAGNKADEISRNLREKKRCSRYCGSSVSEPEHLKVEQKPGNSPAEPSAPSSLWLQTDSSPKGQKSVIKAAVHEREAPKLQRQRSNRRFKDLLRRHGFRFNTPPSFSRLVAGMWAISERHQGAAFRHVHAHASRSAHFLPGLLRGELTTDRLSVAARARLLSAALPWRPGCPKCRGCLQGTPAAWPLVWRARPCA